MDHRVGKLEETETQTEPAESYLPHILTRIQQKRSAAHDHGTHKVIPSSGEK